MKKFLFTAICVFCVLCGTVLSACSIFTPTETPDNANTDNTSVGKIGDTIVNTDGVAICLVSVENTTQLGTEYLGETTENNFVLLTVNVKNNSSKQQTFSGTCANLYNSNNVKYEAKTSLYIDFIISEDIGAGISKTFQIVFETPTTTKQEKYTVKIGYSSYTINSKRVTFELV